MTGPNDLLEMWMKMGGEWRRRSPDWDAYPRPIAAAGPNDFFEISGNNSPDPPDDDDETHEPQDYTGDYPLEGDVAEDE